MAPSVACTAPVDDWAIDDKTALLFSPEAPIASASPATSTSKRDDRTAIWTFIPDAFDYAKPEALFYFHGHNNYVKVGYCDHKEGLTPDWVLGTRKFEVDAKASGPKYGLNSLPTTPHAPLVIVPEVGRNNPDNSNTTKYPNINNVLDTADHYKEWRKQKKEWDDANAAYNKAVKDKVTPLPAKPPPPPQPVPASMPTAVTETAGRMGTDVEQIKKMIDDCCTRLRRLSKRVTTSATYLETKPDKLVDSTKLKRLYLTGHSGGGVPLTSACTNKLARLTGKDDMPTDLWVFDGTYGTGKDEYTSFCKDLSDKGKLGNGPLLSRFVAVVIKNSSTDVDVPKEGQLNRMTTIVKKMRDSGLTVKEVEFKADSDIPMIKSTVMCNPITIIRNTAVEHDHIPTKFIPILLVTAGQLGPDCKGTPATGFMLKVVDPNDKALAGNKVKVLQDDKMILASNLGSDGTVWVSGHDLGRPVDVNVEGFGGLGKEGHLDLDEPDDGTLPGYEPGTAADGDGSCGGSYSPPVIVA
jgi:hypothetical protein